jgi:hypothetical protein
LWNYQEHRNSHGDQGRVCVSFPYVQKITEKTRSSTAMTGHHYRKLTVKKVLLRSEAPPFPPFSCQFKKRRRFKFDWKKKKKKMVVIFFGWCNAGVCCYSNSNEFRISFLFVVFFWVYFWTGKVGVNLVWCVNVCGRVRFESVWSGRGGFIGGDWCVLWWEGKSAWEWCDLEDIFVWRKECFEDVAVYIGATWIWTGGGPELHKTKKRKKT